MPERPGRKSLKLELKFKIKIKIKIVYLYFFLFSSSLHFLFISLSFLVFCMSAKLTYDITSLNVRGLREQGKRRSTSKIKNPNSIFDKKHILK